MDKKFADFSQENQSHIYIRYNKSSSFSILLCLFVFFPLNGWVKLLSACMMMRKAKLKK